MADRRPSPADARGDRQEGFAMSGRVLLDPANPHDFTRAELEELAQKIREDAPGTEVLPAFRPEEGFGGPWSEVLYIWHETKEGVETSILLGAAIKWMKRRWERDRDEHPPSAKPRSRSITVIEDDR